MLRLNTIFENTFCLDFVVTYEINGKTETRELCEGGAAFCLEGQMRSKKKSDNCIAENMPWVPTVEKKP